LRCLLVDILVLANIYRHLHCDGSEPIIKSTLFRLTSQLVVYCAHFLHQYTIIGFDGCVTHIVLTTWMINSHREKYEDVSLSTVIRVATPLGRPGKVREFEIGWGDGQIQGKCGWSVVCYCNCDSPK